MKQKFFYFFILLICSVAPVQAQDFPDVCQESENILSNCGFENGLDGWHTFTEAGGANITILQGGGECHAPLCPAAYIVVEDHFIGGIYQQVSVTSGNKYYANIVWLVFDALINDPSIRNAVGGGIGRRLGVDPYGGTDSTSSNIIWSPDNWRSDCKICNQEQVTVKAESDTITLFIRLEDDWRLRAKEHGFSVPPSKDQFWLDDVGVKQVGEDAPTNENEEPTPIPSPTPLPTETSPPPEPTATEVLVEDIVEEEENEVEEDNDVAQIEESQEIEDTELIEEDESDEEEEVSEEPGTEEPQSTEEPLDETPTLADTSSKNSVALLPTLTPTPTPTPSATPKPRPTPTSQQLLAQSSAHISPQIIAGSNSEAIVDLKIVGATLCVGGLILMVMAIFMMGLVWLYRLGWGKLDDDDEFYDDDSDEIIVDIVQ